MSNKLTKSDLKNMLKPIVKECIQESLLEDGLLSGIIAEVIRGVSSTQTIVEDTRKEQHIMEQQKRQEEEETQYIQQLSETKKKMLDAIGKETHNGINLFENTEPISSAPDPGNSVGPNSPLSGVSPKDSGVDIDGLLSTVGKNWGKLAKGN